MNGKLRPRLAVEALENRETPSASLTFSGGTLTIRGDNTANNVQITETAGNYAVKVNTANLGTYRATSLSVTMGNSNDTFTLTFTDTTPLPGTLSANMGNGNDSFTVQGPSPTTRGRVGGNTTINTGLGGALAGAFGDEVHLIDTDFGGQLLSVTGSPGSSTEELDTDGNNIAGTFSITNVYFSGIGRVQGANAGLEPTNAAQIVVNNAQKNTDADVTAANGPGNLFNLYGNSTVAGNLTYTGGSGSDEVGLAGFGFSGTVNGNLSVNGNGGANTLFIGGGGGDPGFVNGSVSFTDVNSSGADRFFLDSGSVVGNTVNVNLGNGNNQFLLGTAGGFTVGGNLNLTAGNGNNFVATPSSPSTVNGSLSITFGSGTNTGNSTCTTNAINIDNNLSVGGSITYRAGSGTNRFDFSNSNYAGNLQVLLSGGDSTVNFCIPDYFGNATIDFGTGFGSKAFETDAVPTTFRGTFVLRNYP